MQSQRFPNAPLGLVFQGTPARPRERISRTGTIGLPVSASAWDVFGTGKTSLRGGTGVFYDILKAETIAV